MNDIKPVGLKNSIKDLIAIFNSFQYSHIPVIHKSNFLGCISKTDVSSLSSSSSLEAYKYLIESFFVQKKFIWLDVLEAFASNDSNIMPVLDDNKKYLGYYELSDFLLLFRETPFFSTSGNVLIVEKGLNDYSFSEISQIVESNNGRLYGVLISKSYNDLVEITLKINFASLSEIIKAFRRFGYSIVSYEQDDIFIEDLKERSEYLNRYLNL